MGLELTITDCNTQEIELIGAIYDAMKGEDEFAFYRSDDYSLISYLVDVLIDYFGGNADGLVASLPTAPDRLLPVADKLEEFSKIIRSASILSDEEQREIRRKAREQK
jgi:hypothetical protein